jgi:hypothetical protein
MTCERCNKEVLDNKHGWFRKAPELYCCEKHFPYPMANSIERQCDECILEQNGNDIEYVHWMHERDKNKSFGCVFCDSGIGFEDDIRDNLQENDVGANR